MLSALVRTYVHRHDVIDDVANDDLSFSKTSLAEVMVPLTPQPRHLRPCGVVACTIGPKIAQRARVYLLQSAPFRCLLYFFHRAYERCRAHRNFVHVHNPPKSCVCIDHVLFQLAVDFALGPFVFLNVLGPLEVAHRHAASIGENVGNAKNVPATENLVGFSRTRAVGRFDDILRRRSR